MARMFPERLSGEVPTSERRVHEALRVGLDDTFVVFHSIAVIAPASIATRLQGLATRTPA